MSIDILKQIAEWKENAKTKIPWKQIVTGSMLLGQADGSNRIVMLPTMTDEMKRDIEELAKVEFSFQENTPIGPVMHTDKLLSFTDDGYSWTVKFSDYL